MEQHNGVVQLPPRAGALTHERLALAQRDRARAAVSRSLFDAHATLVPRNTGLRGAVRAFGDTRATGGGAPGGQVLQVGSDDGGSDRRTVASTGEGGLSGGEEPPTRSVTSATDHSTSADIDERAVEAGEGIADLDVSDTPRDRDEEDDEFHDRSSRMLDYEDDDDRGGEDEYDDDSDDVEEDEVLQENEDGGGEGNYFHFKEEDNNSGEGGRGGRETSRKQRRRDTAVRRLCQDNCRLTQALAVAQQVAQTQRVSLESVTLERDALRRKLQVQHRLQPAIRCSTPQVCDAVAVRGLLRGSHSNLHRATDETPVGMKPTGAFGGGGTCSSPAPSGGDCLPDNEDPPIICRMAERVRLKQVNTLGHVTGCDLRHVGVCTSGVAEQLMASLSEESHAQELFHALATAGGALAPHERLREYEVEVERLSARVDHLKAQNDVLALTLSESKAHCDHLSILMGKNESNSSALQLTVTTLDMTVEALEVLVALLESELGLLLATYRATEGGGGGVEGRAELVSAMRLSQEHRRATEGVARHLLSRCERELNMSGECRVQESCPSDEISRAEEVRLRHLINRLKGDRRNIAASVVPLEPLLTDPLTPRHPLPEGEALQLDLENSVLMQELTAVREDRAELRAQVYLLEREKAGLELRVGTCEAREMALLATIDLLKAQGGARQEFSSADSGIGDVPAADVTTTRTTVTTAPPLRHLPTNPPTRNTFTRSFPESSSFSNPSSSSHNEQPDRTASGPVRTASELATSASEPTTAASEPGTTFLTKTKSGTSPAAGAADAGDVATADVSGDSGPTLCQPSVYECLLRDRIQVLVGTLEKLTANSEARHRQSQQFIDDLKKANSALVAAVERLKKKYAVRVRRMEQQSLTMMERRGMEVHSLKQTILDLEEQLSALQGEEEREGASSPNETCL